MSSYGFRSAAAFLRTSNIPRTTFDAIAADKYWVVAKRVLLHKECPADIRDNFANGPIWFKRVTACMAGNAPESYRFKLKSDPDSRARIYYGCYLLKQAQPILKCLHKLGIRSIYT